MRALRSEVVSGHVRPEQDYVGKAAEVLLDIEPNDPGQVRFQFMVDSNGTLDDPSDDTFVADLGRVFGSTGRNDLQELDFCDAVLDVIG